MDGHGKLHRGMPGWWQTCEAIGEHQGDAYETTDNDGVRWEKWRCCGEAEVLGEVYECHRCGAEGVAAGGVPAGWSEDDTGFVCPSHTGEAAAGTGAVPPVDLQHPSSRARRTT